MLRSKCATLVLRGGVTSVGVVLLVFPGFARFSAYGRLRLISGQKSFFLRNGAIFGVVRRKNRSFCGASFSKKFGPNRQFGWFFAKSLAQIVRSAVGSVLRADKEPEKMYG